MSFLVPKRRLSSSLFDIRLRVETSGTTTVAGTTRCALCARSQRSQRWWWLQRSRQQTLTLRTSRPCVTSSRRSSNSAVRPTQSVAFLLSTRVVDGVHRLEHRPHHRGSRRRALSQKGPLLHDMTSRRRYVLPGVLLRSRRLLLTHGQALIPLRCQTQCHGRNHRPRAPIAVHHALPIAHFSSLSVIRIRMMRYHARHPSNAAALAQDHAIILVVGLSNFRKHLA